MIFLIKISIKASHFIKTFILKTKTGHSLGAHIVGAAGRNLNYKTDKLLPRITGNSLNQTFYLYLSDINDIKFKRFFNRLQLSHMISMKFDSLKAWTQQIPALIRVRI